MNIGNRAAKRQVRAIWKKYEIITCQSLTKVVCSDLRVLETYPFPCKGLIRPLAREPRERNRNILTPAALLD
jgi:hypothetical protein